MVKTTLIILFLVLTFNADCQISGVIKKVIDGDTFIFKSDSLEIKVRLLDIDCPEHDQPFADSCKLFIENLKNKKLTLYPKNKDRYNRTLAYLYNNNVNINYLMVQNGYAWKWKHCKNTSLDSLQNQAKTKESGLWKYPNPIDPSDWRKK